MYSYTTVTWLCIYIIIANCRELKHEAQVASTNLFIKPGKFPTTNSNYKHKLTNFAPFFLPSGKA